MAVLSDVWRNIVFTHARVGEGVGIALVVDGGHGGDARLLEADEWALSLVLITPELSISIRDAFRVDPVWVVVLDIGLGSAEAGKGDDAESRCETHVEDFCDCCDGC